MANVSFEEEQSLASGPIASRKSRGITGWLIATKLAKDEKSATTVMLGIVGLCVVVAGAFFVMAGGDSRPLTESEKFRLEQSTPLPSR